MPVVKEFLAYVHPRFCDKRAFQQRSPVVSQVKEDFVDKLGGKSHSEPDASRVWRAIDRVNERSGVWVVGN